MWALHKHFPHVKIYVRAHDVEHGLNLEKARSLLLSQWPHWILPYTHRQEAPCSWMRLHVSLVDLANGDANLTDANP